MHPTFAPWIIWWAFALLTPYQQNHDVQEAKSNSNDLIIRAATAVSLPDEVDLPSSHLPMPKWNREDQTVTKSYYVAHKAPISTYLILSSPAIASFVLVKGWNTKSLMSFTNAVNAVVEKNPVLTGRAIFPTKLGQPPQIDIIPGYFLPNQHTFVETIDLREKLRHRRSLDNLDTLEQLNYMDRHVAPRVGKHGSTLDHIRSESPLFQAKVFLLPKDYACIYTKLSHCVGDLVTYYMLLDQISSFDGGGAAEALEQVRPIQWDNPMAPLHEIYPEEFSTRDIQRLYGIPFLLGIGSHIPTMHSRKQEFILLDDEKIRQQKKRLKDETGLRGITSNDIITSALCDANRSTDIFALTRSMRGVIPGLHQRDAGNLHCEIPFHRVAGRNPFVIKNIMDRGRYFEPGEVPVFESLSGRVGRISNCVAPVNRMTFGGLHPICYSPPKAFLDLTPMDIAIIFRATRGETAVLHNFQKMTHSDLLDDILLKK